VPPGASLTLTTATRGLGRGVRLPSDSSTWSNTRTWVPTCASPGVKVGWFASVIGFQVFPPSVVLSHCWDTTRSVPS
jgi:hypothetical protein